MTTYDIEKACQALFVEQHDKSPHQYLTDDFTVPDNAVFVDVGAAEGNMSLKLVEKAKKVYIIEADPTWRPALEATFEPWADKVEIICKYASDTSNANEISVDSLFEKEGRIDFIKIDVEGAEEKVIHGSVNTIKSSANTLKLALCTYHKDGDAEKFSQLLKSYNFKISFSDGYMIFPYSETYPKPPYLRKGLIRATLTPAYN
ncbi:MAG: hypothetical protein EOP47_27885 [Sphingobacteriaceae bacterium]|nr:MAG: hypothetical protein EOP47_27885 [Sphingobacteriaceae bacterium]